MLFWCGDVIGFPCSKNKATPDLIRVGRCYDVITMTERGQKICSKDVVNQVAHVGTPLNVTRRRRSLFSANPTTTSYGCWSRICLKMDQQNIGVYRVFTGVKVTAGAIIRIRCGKVDNDGRRRFTNTGGKQAMGKDRQRSFPRV